jgi:hypothetical protein
VEGLEGAVKAVGAEGVDGRVLLGGGEGAGADGAEARALAAEVDGDVEELDPAVEERGEVELAVGDGEGGEVDGGEARFGDDLLVACEGWVGRLVGRVCRLECCVDLGCNWHCRTAATAPRNRQDL